MDTHIRTRTHTHTHTHSYGLMSPSKQIITYFKWKVFLHQAPWCDRQQDWCDNKNLSEEDKSKTVSPTGQSCCSLCFYLSYKQKPLHFNATSLFVSMSLDVSTESQCVAPQARRRYLVIYIEIHGPKWGEGGQVDCLSAYQYPLPLSTPYQDANLLATQYSFDPYHHYPADETFLTLTFCTHKVKSKGCTCSSWINYPSNWMDKQTRTMWGTGKLACVGKQYIQTRN